VRHPNVFLNTHVYNPFLLLLLFLLWCNGPIPSLDLLFFRLRDVTFYAEKL